MEQQSQLVSPSPSSAAAEGHTCLHTSANFKWFYNQFAREKKKALHPFHSLHESKWRRVSDKEVLMICTKTADSALGQQANNKWNFFYRVFLNC